MCRAIRAFAARPGPVRSWLRAMFPQKRVRLSCVGHSGCKGRKRGSQGESNKLLAGFMKKVPPRMYGLPFRHSTSLSSGFAVFLNRSAPNMSDKIGYSTAASCLQP